MHIPSNTKSNETKSQKVTVLHSSSKHTSPYGKFYTRIRIQILNPLSTIFHSVLILHFNSFSNRRSFRFLPFSIDFNPYFPSSLNFSLSLHRTAKLQLTSAFGSKVSCSLRRYAISTTFLPKNNYYFSNKVFVLFFMNYIAVPSEDESIFCF